MHSSDLSAKAITDPVADVADKHSVYVGQPRIGGPTRPTGVESGTKTSTKTLFGSREAGFKQLTRKDLEEGIKDTPSWSSLLESTKETMLAYEATKSQIKKEQGANQAVIVGKDKGKVKAKVVVDKDQAPTST